MTSLQAAVWQQLCEAFAVFEPPRPLGLGVREELQAWAPIWSQGGVVAEAQTNSPFQGQGASVDPDTVLAAVFEAVGRHTASPEYLRVLVQGAARVRLDGSPSGEQVSQKQAQRAVQRLRAHIDLSFTRSKHNRNALHITDFDRWLTHDTTGLDVLHVRLSRVEEVFEIAMSPKAFRRVQRFCRQYPLHRVFAKPAEFKGTGRLGLYCLKSAPADSAGAGPPGKSSAAAATSADAG